MASKALTFTQSLATRKPYGIVSTFSISKISDKTIDSFKPDVIHLHNWFNLLSLDQLERLLAKYPVLINLHDQRLISGGCHLPMDCLHYLQNCKPCKAVKFGGNLVSNNHQRILRLLGRQTKFSLVAPSRWGISPFLNTSIGKNSIENLVIPNIIEKNYFEKQKSEYSSLEDLHILFIASNINTEIKGLDILLSAVTNTLRDFNVTKQIHINVIGDGEQKPEPNVDYLGIVSNSKLASEMLKYDLCVVPSLVDNSPGTLIQSILVGLPVLASNVGGIPEIMGRCGLENRLFDPNSKSLSLAIKNFMETPREEIISAALRARKELIIAYDPESIVSRYSSAYKNLINQEKDNG
jgi:glycosyltransferase involved in cell wall biosynthesis